MHHAVRDWLESFEAKLDAVSERLTVDGEREFLAALEPKVRARLAKVTEEWKAIEELAKQP